MSQQKKILIVDDEPDITELTKRFLQFEKYDTITCNSGQDALHIIEEQHEEIALVLLDIMMPEMDGFTLLQLIKSNDSYKNLLVVLFSVKNFHFDIVKGKELGADGYLVKAISGKELISYVKNILGENVA